MAKHQPIQSPPNRAAVSVDEFAVAIGISRAHAFALVARGDVRSYRLGKRRLVPVTEFARLATLADPESVDSPAAPAQRQRVTR